MSILIHMDGKPLYDSRLPAEAGLSLLGAKIEENVNKAGSATLTVPRNNCRYNDFLPLKSLVEVYRDNVLRWRGRALLPGRDFYGRKTVKCEGELCFFQDSSPRAEVIQGKPADVFASLIISHNQRVEQWKRFALGNVTVSGDDVAMTTDGSKKTYTLLTNLIRERGGYILFDSAPDGTRRVNWYDQFPWVCNQTVRCGQNLTDLSTSGDVSNVVTRIVPYGAKQDDGTRLQLDLDGVDYVENPDAVALRGVVEAGVIYDTVTTREELQTMAEQDLLYAWEIPETIKLSAVDMGRQDLHIDHFAVGQKVPAESAYHNLSGTYDLIALTEDLLNPTTGSVTLTRDASYVSTVPNSLSGSLSQAQSQTRDALSEGQKRAIALLTNGLGYMAIRLNPDGSPMDTLYMDHPDIKTAVNVLRIGQSGIGFSHSGVDGPYESAWTLDGQFYADSIHLTGKFGIYQDGHLMGYMGYMEGSDGTEVTRGICVSNADGTIYGVATNAGFRIQAGSLSCYLEKDAGSMVVNGNLIVKGTVTSN